MRLKGQVAIVTGGGGGIGEGICLCLAKEGADVIVSDVNMGLAEKVAEKINKIGVRSSAVRTDVRYENECIDLVKNTISEYGGVDILVCCAGTNGFSMRENQEAPLGIENLTEEVWDLTMDVNLKGVFLCNKAVISHFMEKMHGKIINISSVAGRNGAAPLPHYSASKAGVINFSQAMATYMGPYNVNVNTICPGVIWTPLWEEFAKVVVKTNPDFEGSEPKDVIFNMVDERIPLQRVQMAEDIGNTVVFLASSEAKEITGQALNVDGGMVMS
ncbi:MAG: glucose 1-dehydrogenase [Desulfobacterales bacterium]|jgi:NAD(P)-dependent dehydrogenase (short-subunit alcohol dehydrogenase family)|nr:glucose 1-dehydrogenase [Desulfobacteraceae bacterium]MBT4364941.1 glucose 1-dehydrogenase [Desulfobacteraceae bacterium]MBT7085732.1 glucose 1-dehydrogenase [Desulfobacterales bacterium]MBT7696175.1 glucose 1-dehydrogenase [Desulfobacterales bacterium]